MDTGAAEKKLVRVAIFQQIYTLRSTGDPGETEALADAVNQLMNQIASRAGTNDPARIGVLAALHLADQVRQLERDTDLAREQLKAAQAAQVQLNARLVQLEKDLASARAGQVISASDHEQALSRLAQLETQAAGLESQLADFKSRAARLADKAAELTS